MGFDKANPDINAPAQQGVRFLQHPVRFTYAGTHTNVNFELPPPGLAEEVQKMFGVLIAVVAQHYGTIDG